jgi:hypothetical protein
MQWKYAAPNKNYMKGFEMLNKVTTMNTSTTPDTAKSAIPNQVSASEWFERDNIIGIKRFLLKKHRLPTTPGNHPKFDFASGTDTFTKYT